MVIGFDVYHGGKAGGRSVGAMTCTTSDSYGRYYSCVSFYEKGIEISATMALDVESKNAISMHTNVKFEDL